jgi:microsomal dipeptidase-like Zn-dependent dipeptidase
MHRRPLWPRFAAAAGAVALLVTVSGLTTATALPTWTGAEQRFEVQARSETPEDRYAMAGGCYAIRVGDDGYVVRTDDGFATSGSSLEEAEPFHFQATDLGSYLLYGSAPDFLAASEGAVGEAAYSITRSTPGATAGGLVMEETDKAADTAARSEANTATGRGESVVAADEASNLADWKIDGPEGGPFTIELPETSQSLAAEGGELVLLAGPGTGDTFTFELTDGCAAFPEVEINIDGPALGADNDFQEVRGLLEAHLHMMAFEFIGGRVRCGRPWHRFGVASALVDCPDHEPGGAGAALEMALSGPGPHDTDGWPTFEGWPRPESLTHEQVYYKWLERAWRGGLRLATNLLVDNGQLCKVYPFKRHGCNEMDGVRLQAQHLEDLQDYIDAQSGGPGEGWFRIVTDPFEARQVINEGKLAIVMGIEVSVPLDCGLSFDQPTCNTTELVERLDEVHEMGVRQMELVNKFDNAFSGVTGDGGFTGPVVNAGNFGETNHFWRMETCTEDDGHAHDKTQPNFHDDSGAPDEFSGRDSIFGGVLATAGVSGAAPIYPEGPHCNLLGLSDLGKTMIAEMAQRNMIFDPDHMSARARTQALDFIQNEMAKVHGQPYSGIVSSHGWADDTIYERIYELGGVVTPHAGDSTSFIEKWQKHRGWADDRFHFGFGFGSDMNGFSAQGDPRGADAEDPVTYPFTGFGGVVVDQQVSGSRTYDINTDGVAHYGLYPDWLEDIRRQAGDEIIDDLIRGPEAFLQMWERALGIAPDACRSDVDDLTDDRIGALQAGMSPRVVLETLGQPSSRMGADFTYCMTDQRTATLTFDADGNLTTWGVTQP